MCLVLLCGCHITGNPLDLAVMAFDRGDTAAALTYLDELEERRDAESDILALDRSVVHLLASDPESTIRTLETARQRLNHLEQVDLAEQTQAAWNDERSIAWSGREFERRMVDNLQIVASLLQNEDDAFALATRGMEAVRSDELQLLPTHELAESDQTPGESPPVMQAPGRHAANQMTAWLAAAVHSERIQDADLTNRLIQQVSRWKPSDESSSDSLQPLGTHTSRGTGTLQVVILASRISPWRPERAIPTSAALLAADRILTVTGKHSLPPTTSPVLIARPVHRRFDPQFQTQVSVGTLPTEVSRVFVDLNAAAWDSWEADRDQQLANAVVRRIVKKGTVYGAKNALNVPKGSGTDLLLNVAGSLWESREQADLRQWNLLPAAIELTQMELPAGRHIVRLEVHPSGHGTATHPIDRLELPVTIEDGHNTFVVCFRLQGKLQGVQSNR